MIPTTTQPPMATAIRSGGASSPAFAPSRPMNAAMKAKDEPR